MITLKRASVNVGTGDKVTGRIAARRENKGLVYVMVDNNPALDNWYTVTDVEEITE